MGDTVRGDGAAIGARWWAGGGFVVALRAWVGRPPVEVAVLLALASRATAADGRAWPSLRTLAADAGVSRATVCRALMRLEAAGLVTRERQIAAAGDAATTCYVLLPGRNTDDGIVSHGDGVVSQRDNGLSHRETTGSLTERHKLDPIEQEQSELDTGTRADARARRPPLGVGDWFLAAWREHAPRLRGVRTVTGARLRRLRALDREHGRAELVAAMARANGSAFCTGGGPRGWIADVDWFVRPGVVVRLLEGAYDGPAGGATGPRLVTAASGRDTARETAATIAAAAARLAAAGGRE